MTNKIELSVNETLVEALSTNLVTETWEPYYIDGQQIGSMHWIEYSEDPLYQVGLWRITPEEAPDLIPYIFEGRETFHVFEGAAQLITNEGLTIDLKVGDVYTFPTGVEVSWRILTPFKKLFIVSPA